MTEILNKLDDLHDSANNKKSIVQLWQFLLELLIDKEYLAVIRWHGTEGEFEFLEPDQVALLWGQRKGFSNMNYAKLSRALRNYYSTGILNKVPGHQYIYKFMFDISELLGYSVLEICDLLSYSK
jgi:E74-like factor 5